MRSCSNFLRDMFDGCPDLSEQAILTLFSLQQQICINLSFLNMLPKLKKTKGWTLHKISKLDYQIHIKLNFQRIIEFKKQK